jgi:hypothetical protein
MMRVFHEPLTKNKLLDKKTLAAIFGGIPELISLNRELVYIYSLLIYRLFTLSFNFMFILTFIYNYCCICLLLLFCC